VADVLVRVGDPKLDNTHGQHRSSALETVPLPLTDDKAAIERSLWFATNSDYGGALHNYLQVKTETQVRAKEEDSSADFSKQSPTVAIGEAVPAPAVNQPEWEARVKKLSELFRAYPDVYTNVVSLQVQNETDYFVSSEGAKIAAPHQLTRLIIFASTRAEDGMELLRAQTFEAENPAGLPPAGDVEAAVRKLGESLEALRKAPVTEPFDGPAILSGRAAAVFFHEVLGHRLEGQRQRGDEEGQTFTKNLGKPILPSFLSVADDPTMKHFENTWLSGTYDFDDEGQPAKKVNLIDDGVLKTFLMSRLPIASFSESNGHGRSQTGRMPTGRQGNLIVTSTKTVPDANLRQMLIDEAKKQGKAYGLMFEDISSGFAVTTRNSPQAFQVLPLVVYRVYVDGRPDELVRGVSIVGTPRAALNQILATGTKRDVFNGECGAESGSIPVSAIAPAMLVSRIETQKQAQGTARPPILPIPGAPEAVPAKGGQ
jgi:predicted Zn-dependent protease